MRDATDPRRAGRTTAQAAPRHGPLGPFRALLGPPLSGLYAAVIAARNRKFDAGRGVIEFDRPVISVGNLSVGGTGKTPLVMYALGLLTRAGHHPCVAMRGYRSAQTGGSDEAAEYSRAFPGMPVVARPDRSEGLIELFAGPTGEEIDSIVLDDGFQHRRIARQSDIVVIDGSTFPPEESLLPSGWLREPATSVRRATFAVVMRASDSHDSEIKQNVDWLSDVFGPSKVGVAQRSWSGVRAVEGGVERAEHTHWLTGKKIAAVCAIGNPHQFLSQLSAASGKPPAASLALRDHDGYSARTIQRIAEMALSAGAQAIVTTEKDWSKLSRVRADFWPCPIARPTVELTFDTGAEEFQAHILETASLDLASDPGE